ncbi:cytoskeletal protein RodZ [Oikeobacillus pervagus]|uniref:Cytoskeletal protein RodZ n=1 Tax=Oikeobacillus pervagus TaxID=1325931 RepID=A0AAJ1WFQ5_9BACI|nr:cytoskeletal protein RodZ [Oikeobacillus pervagus]
MTELGNRLKEARKAKGLSLEQIQEMTKIQKRYLIGIEEGNYDIMPGQFYVRAFIKQYAEAVGLDPEELFDEYKDDIPTAKEDEVPQRITNVKTTSTKAVPTKSTKFFDYLPQILVAAFIIGAIFLVWVLKGGNPSDDGKQEETVQVEESNQSQNIKEESKEDSKADNKQEVKGKETKKEAKDEKKKVKKKSNKDQAIQVVSTNGRKTIYKLENTDEFKLTVTSKGETWVEISDGTGKKYFSNMLRNGESQEHDLTGQTAAKIVVGFAPDTEIKVNGQTLKYEQSATDLVRQDIEIQFEKKEE